MRLPFYTTIHSTLPPPPPPPPSIDLFLYATSGAGPGASQRCGLLQPKTHTCKGEREGGQGGTEVGAFIVNEECPARRTLPSVVVSPASGAVFLFFGQLFVQKMNFFGDF